MFLWLLDEDDEDDYDQEHTYDEVCGVCEGVCIYSGEYFEEECED